MEIHGHDRGQYLVRRADEPSRVQESGFLHVEEHQFRGTALVKATAERWAQITGCTIVEGYGLTETSPVASANPYGTQARLGTVGIPVPGTAMKVIDDEGVELPFGERGELCIKGPQVMKGY